MASKTTPSELPALEATMKRDHSQLFSNIAASLHSSAKRLQLKAEEVEQQNLYAKAAAQAQCTERWKVWNGKIEDEKERDPDPEADRVVLGSMEVINAIKQESIIREAVESLLESTTPELRKNIALKQDNNEDCVCEVSSDDIVLFVCHLAVHLIANPEVAEEAEDPREDDDSDDDEEEDEETYDDTKDEHDDHKAFPRSNYPSSESNLQQIYTSEAGFVTQSGWMAINRSQHW